MSSLTTRVALVTGAGSGIGRATALAFAKKNYKVVVSDTNEQGGAKTVDEIKTNKGEANFFKCDVSKEDDVKSLLNHVGSTYGRLDAAFNNAGISGDLARPGHCTLENWQKVIDINLTGVFICTTYEIELMKQTASKNNTASIVNCASIYGKRGFPLATPYTAAKHGVIGLTKASALDLVGDGIRVNAVCPGFIDTAMLGEGEKRAAIDAVVAAKQPIGRLGRPEEVAAAVVFLCSDDASFITGSAMDVDGAYLA